MDGFDDLLKLIDDSLPTDTARAAQNRHQIERWEETIRVLEDQLETGEYALIGRFPTTRQDVIDAIVGYRQMIARRGL